MTLNLRTVPDASLEQVVQDAARHFVVRKFEEARIAAIKAAADVLGTLQAGRYAELLVPALYEQQPGSFCGTHKKEIGAAIEVMTNTRIRSKLFDLLNT